MLTLQRDSMMERRINSLQEHLAEACTRFHRVHELPATMMKVIQSSNCYPENICVFLVSRPYNDNASVTFSVVWCVSSLKQPMCPKSDFRNRELEVGIHPEGDTCPSYTPYAIYNYPSTLQCVCGRKPMNPYCLWNKVWVTNSQKHFPVGYWLGEIWVSGWVILLPRSVNCCCTGSAVHVILPSYKALSGIRYWKLHNNIH